MFFVCVEQRFSFPTFFLINIIHKHIDLYSFGIKEKSEHFTTHNIYYMHHTIDKLNVYCSYTIKCIFAGMRMSGFDSATFSAGC